MGVDFFMVIVVFLLYTPNGQGGWSLKKYSGTFSTTPFYSSITKACYSFS